jgi:alginate O-acetyltransferase complex protein AlgI
MVEPVHELGFALLFQVFQLFQYRARLRLPFTRVKLPRALLRFPATDGHFVLHVSNPFLYHRHLLSFFPQLVAGPIERASHLIDQLRVHADLRWDNFKQGFTRVLFGLIKKLVIADRLALFVNPIYNDVTSFDGFMLSIATLFFAFQIYCDFSGYSDIAIGIARMFGVDLMENFRSPYLSKDIREFWSRWHISLSTWFRDYVYIPLGGNRTGQSKFYRNIMIVFLVSGFWHGANWTFIIWGGIHGVFLLLGMRYQNLKSRFFPKPNAPKLLASFEVGFTFLVVCFAWIFFRANSLADAFFVVEHLMHVDMSFVSDVVYQLKSVLFDPSNAANRFNLDFGRINLQSSIGDFWLSLIFIPSLLLFEFHWPKGIAFKGDNATFLAWFISIVFIMLFGVFTQNQFIYFQF